MRVGLWMGVNRQRGAETTKRIRGHKMGLRGGRGRGVAKTRGPRRRNLQ